MAPDTTPLLRTATFFLMAIAYAAVEVACDSNGRPSPFGVAFGIGIFAVAILVSRFVPSAAGQRHFPRWMTLALALLLLAPLVLEPVLRQVTGNGQPLELQMVSGLRALGVGLAAFAAWPLCLRLAGVVSLFLMLFVTAMGDQKPIPWLLAAYAGAGSLWLMLVYSSHTRHVTAAQTGLHAATVIERVRLRFPWWEIVLLIVLAVAALSLTVIGPKRVSVVLWELMPTSGGTGVTDPFARFGIGDGPEETAGDNARAAGMVETDKMIEDNKNALIDAVSDMYGPPHKPREDQERMVAAGKVDVIQFHGKLPDNRRPSRDFDTSRKGPKSDKKLESQKARAVFEVEGRTPLHIRLVVYETYDATAARWTEARKPASKLIEAEGGDWMRVGHVKQSAGWYLEDERHRLKVADMKANLVPTPALLTRFRIHKVERPDYYEWDYEGVLALAGRKRTPPGVVVSTDCRTLDPQRLPEAAFASVGTAGGSAPALGEVPDAFRPEIDRIAREWAGDKSRGWPQVEAILLKLRSEYTLDRTASAPADHRAPVLWFLTESRCGPDYLFATATALLLRSLGYQTRVCLGYYAAPDAYDPETAHTPVRGSDLHFWPEVLLRDGQWLVVEPTPGYDVLGPRLPWTERAWLALQAVGLWAVRNAFALTAVLLASAAVIGKRRAILDALFVLLWWLFPGRSWRETVFGCLRLIERRCRWQRCGRTHGQTLAAWAASLQRGAPEDVKLAELVRLGEWAAYAPDLPPPLPPEAIRSVCRRVIESWTLNRLNQLTWQGGAA
jgi:hypothetical protein